MIQQNSAPSAPASKSGIPVLGWLGIGCGTIIIIAIVIISLLVGWCKRTVGDLSEFKKNPEKASAEMVVRLTPGLTLVSQDETKGEMTIRTKDGQEITMSYKDVAAGKFTIKDEKGNITQIGGGDLGKLPAWVPALPKLKNLSSTRHSEGNTVTGLYMGKSSDTADQIEEFFKTETSKLGFTESSRSSINNDGVENRTSTYEGNGKKISVSISGKPATDVKVQVTFEGINDENH